MRSTRGFTLLEMMLSVALIGILAGLSVPLYQSFQIRNDLDIATMSAAQTLRRAQTYSEAVNADSPWGVDFAAGAITLFKGISFASRDSTFDDSINVPSTIVFTGTSDYVFSKLSGLPGSVGTTTIMSSGGDVRTIIVNAKGTITY